MKKIGKPGATVVLIFSIAALYFGAGKLGVAFAYVPASASPVCPASALGLAALLLFGYRVFPGVLLGAFLVRVSSNGDLPTSLTIALGNTLEALSLAYLMNRFACGIRVFEKPERVLAFALASSFSTTISPTIGLASLPLIGSGAWESYQEIWLTWWMGNLSGVLIFTPILILWGTSLRMNCVIQKNAHFIESSIAMTLLFLTAILAFWGILPNRTQEYVHPLITIPPLLWIAVRFSRKVTSFAVFLLGWVALLGTIKSGGISSNASDLNIALVSSQMFAGIASIMAMLLSAAIYSQRQIENAIRERETRDPLTGLSNRLQFSNQLERCLQELQNGGTTFAVLFFDVNRLKLINDALGHEAGDALLIEIGRRIRRVLRPEDTFSRISGDEFAILLRDIRQVSDAEGMAEKVRMALAEPFLFSDQEVFISVSIGIVLGKGTYQSPEEILRDADASMYRANKLGSNRHVIFDNQHGVDPMDTLRLETDLRRALERKEMLIYYQPVYSLGSDELHSFEALIRWKHPRQGLLLPSRFIHLAEDCGMIWNLDCWVLRETCKQIEEWRESRADARTFPVSINLSPRLFFQIDLVKCVEEILQDMNLKAEDIQLEITERVFIERQEEVGETMRRLREMGIKILLDDFGIGFSSLSYLHRFPIDGVKIDRAFVSVMAEDDHGCQVAHAVIQLAHSLELIVIAEGVEKLEQLEELRKIKCEYAQGYLLGYPMDKDSTSIFITKNGGVKLQHMMKLI